MNNLRKFFTYLFLFFGSAIQVQAEDDSKEELGPSTVVARDWSKKSDDTSGCALPCHLPLPCGGTEDSIGKTQLVVLKKGDLGKRDRLLSALRELRIDADVSCPESKRAIDIITRKNFKTTKSPARTLAELSYAVLGMISGTGVTWNAYAYLMAEDYFKIPSTYEQYTIGAGVPAEDWALMFAININTHTFLYIVNGAQMGADISAFFNKAKFSRSYDWGEAPRADDILGNIQYYGYHIPARVAHPILELTRPTLPRVTHWSEYIVDPLLTTIYAANVIPEMGIVVERLLEIMRLNTLLGVPLAFMQRWNEQSRRMSSALHKHYYSRIAKAASSSEINDQRKVLSQVCTNFINKLRNGLLSRAELDAIYETLYSKDKSLSPKAIGERRELDITDIGRLALMAAYGGGAEESYDPAYQEPMSRKIANGLGILTGMVASVSSGIVVKQTSNAALLGLNFSPEAADAWSTGVAAAVGIIRAGSGANNTSEYFKRMYDSLTGHDYYKKTGILNPHFSDVVYGNQEFLFLLSNLTEGIYWSLIYWALSDVPMDMLGIEGPWKGIFIGATALAQGAFEAMESSDDLQLFQHYLNKMRVVRGGCMNFMARASTWIWDTLFCCVRGSWRCTSEEYVADTPREDLKDSIHLFKTLHTAKEIKDFVETATPEVVANMYKLMVEKNPLLRIESDVRYADEEEGAGSRLSTTPIHVAAAGKGPVLSPSSIPSISPSASSLLTSAAAGGSPIGASSGFQTENPAFIHGRAALRSRSSGGVPYVKVVESEDEVIEPEGWCWGRGSLCNVLSTLFSWG